MSKADGPNPVSDSTPPAGTPVVPVRFNPVRIQNPFSVGLLAGLGVLLAIAIATAVAQLATILTWVFAALFLALGLEPMVRALGRRGVPRPAAVAIVFGVIVAGVAGVIVTIAPVIITQASNLVTTVLNYAQNVTWKEFLTRVQDFVGPSIDVNDLASQAIAWLQQNAGKITGGVLSVGVGIASGATGAVVVAILTLYFTASLPTFTNASYRLVPASRRESFAEIADQIFGSVGRYVIGQVLLALCNGVLSFIYLSFIGARLAAVFALIAFVGSLIPLVGTVSAAVVIVLGQLLLAPSATATWIAVAVWYLIYMQVEAYVLSPRIMNRAVRVPGVVVVIAALVGGTLLGILGALVAIPVAAAVLLIIDQVVVPRQQVK